jgi:hypothetical protein
MLELYLLGAFIVGIVVSRRSGYHVRRPWQPVFDLLSGAFFVMIVLLGWHHGRPYDFQIFIAFLGVGALLALIYALGRRQTH